MKQIILVLVLGIIATKSFAGETQTTCDFMNGSSVSVEGGNIGSGNSGQTRQ